MDPSREHEFRVIESRYIYPGKDQVLRLEGCVKVGGEQGGKFGEVKFTPSAGKVISKC